MNYQHKIFAHLLLFVSLEVNLVKGDFADDRVKLGDCFIQYFKLLKSWSIYREPESLNVIPSYEAACKREDMTDIEIFERVTKEFAETLVATDQYTGICRVNFADDAVTKMGHVTEVCHCIKDNCPNTYHPPKMPLVSYLKGLYERSLAALPQKNHKQMRNMFSQSCES